MIQEDNHIVLYIRYNEIYLLIKKNKNMLKGDNFFSQSRL